MVFAWARRNTRTVVQILLWDSEYRRISQLLHLSTSCSWDMLYTGTRAPFCRSIRHCYFSLIVKAFSSSYNTRITVHFQSVFTADYRSRYRVEFYNGQFDIMPLLANITFNRTLESFSSYSNDLLVRLCHSCDDPRSRSCWNQSDQIQLYVVNDDGKHTWNRDDVISLRNENMDVFIQGKKTCIDKGTCSERG